MFSFNIKHSTFLVLTLSAFPHSLPTHPPLPTLRPRAVSSEIDVVPSACFRPALATGWAWGVRVAGVGQRRRIARAGARRVGVAGDLALDDPVPAAVVVAVAADGAPGRASQDAAAYARARTSARTPAPFSA